MSETSPSTRLEVLDAATWRDFMAAPVAVLVLCKSDCLACAEWTQELSAFLATDTRYTQVRFGKLVLDQRGFTDFKREHPWIAEVTELPFNVILKGGEKVREFAGGGTDRLLNRLARVAATGAGG